MFNFCATFFELFLEAFCVSFRDLLNPDTEGASRVVTIFFGFFQTILDR